jgi:hypothetical protein
VNWEISTCETDGIRIHSIHLGHGSTLGDARLCDGSHRVGRRYCGSFDVEVEVHSCRTHSSTALVDVLTSPG